MSCYYSITFDRLFKHTRSLSLTLGWEIKVVRFEESEQIISTNYISLFFTTSKSVWPFYRQKWIDLHNTQKRKRSSLVMGQMNDDLGCWRKLF